MTQKKGKTSAPRYLLQITSTNDHGGGIGIALATAQNVKLVALGRRNVRPASRGGRFSIVGENPDPTPLEVGDFVLAHVTQTEEADLFASNWGVVPSSASWLEVVRTAFDLSCFKGRRFNFGGVKGEILNIALDGQVLRVTYWRTRESRVLNLHLAGSELLRTPTGLKIGKVREGQRTGTFSIETPSVETPED